MIIKHYNDFDECFIKMNRDFIENPSQGFLSGDQLLLPYLIVELDSFKCDKVDLGKVGYNNRKWSHLLSHYLDIESLKNFYESLRSGANLTYSLDFKPVIKNGINGGCLKSMTLTRIGRKLRKDKSKWREAHVYWRTCQLELKFAGDLILISQILANAPNCDIKRVVFHIPQAYISGMYVSYLIEPVFGFKFDDLPAEDNNFFRYIHSYDKWKDPNHRLCKRSSVAKYQQFYRDWKSGKRIKPLTIKDCPLPID